MGSMRASECVWSVCALAGTTGRDGHWMEERTQPMFAEANDETNI